MKKKVLIVMTGGLFIGALFFSFSSSSNGEFSFIKSAKAAVTDGTRQPYTATFSDGTTITLCGQGTSNCTPSGTCP